MVWCMKTLFTIGYTKKSLQEFVTLLQINKIEKLVDIRLKNKSQLAGFAKGEDLKFLLEDFLNIKYSYQPLLAPTEAILNKYRSDKNWDEYVSAFTKLMQERDMKNILKKEILDADRVCLLCSEDIPKQCHRRLLAENYKQYNDAIEIIHLSKKDLKNYRIKKSSGNTSTLS
jgi:uncharacterized protein (DUF488 family)